MYSYARHVEMYKNILGMYKINIYMTSLSGSLSVILKSLKQFSSVWEVIILGEQAFTW